MIAQPEKEEGGLDLMDWWGVIELGRNLHPPSNLVDDPDQSELVILSPAAT
jgi:hypothetical protein